MDSDLELVKALRERRPAAFEALYRRYRDRVWRFLCRLAGPGAEDLFQETWIAAARNAHLLRDNTALLPWLFTIAHNKHRNGVRSWARQARMQTDLAGLPAAAPASVDDCADRQREIARTRLALARLPEAYRDALVLCVVEGLDAAQAAAVLGCTSDAVRKRLSRARAQLARAVGRFTQGERT